MERPNILKEKQQAQHIDRTSPNLAVTRPRAHPKASFCSTGAPHSTIKYKSYGIPHPSVEKVFVLLQTT
jgi:hypothetical protein